jgi:hypothetical protein
MFISNSLVPASFFKQPPKQQACPNVAFDYIQFTGPRKGKAKESAGSTSATHSAASQSTKSTISTKVQKAFNALRLSKKNKSKTTEDFLGSTVDTQGQVVRLFKVYIDNDLENSEAKMSTKAKSYGNLQQSDDPDPFGPYSLQRTMDMLERAHNKSKEDHTEPEFLHMMKELEVYIQEKSKKYVGLEQWISRLPGNAQVSAPRMSAEEYAKTMRNVQETHTNLIPLRPVASLPAIKVPAPIDQPPPLPRRLSFDDPSTSVPRQGISYFDTSSSSSTPRTATPNTSIRKRLTKSKKYKS